jgi:amidophosphoribosyltransferase
MCGIFGIHGHPHAAEISHLGLYSLQHRGQESAGIVASDIDGNAHAIKRMGLVSEGLSIADVDRMRGDVAIGHTRYSTAGSSTIENAQPVLARFRDGHIALAHNGNLTNATEMRRDLENAGSIFNSTMDSEVLVHRIARSASDAPEAKLADALQNVEGAYSLVVTIGDTLLAARDPRGWPNSETATYSRARAARSISSAPKLFVKWSPARSWPSTAKALDRHSRLKEKRAGDACSSTCTSHGRIVASLAAP